MLLENTFKVNARINAAGILTDLGSLCLDVPQRWFQGASREEVVLQTLQELE